MDLRKFLCAALAATYAASAQGHGYTAGDIEEGLRRYRVSCIGCHGADGASVSGIDLGRGKFRRVSTDDEIANVIVNGVPGTGMPPTPMGPTRAYTIVAFLRTMNDAAATGRRSIAAKNGDAARGKTLFESPALGCAGCHRIRGAGGRTGPDLSEAGVNLVALEIETAILDPDAEYSTSARPYRVVSKSGAAINGRLLNQDMFSIQMHDGQGNLRSIERSEIREAGPAKSPMPSFRNRVNPRDLADLIAYIAAQRGDQ